MSLPVQNATTPSEPLGFSVTAQINGTLLFEWNDPVVKPIGTQVEITRSTNSADASVGTVVWRGDTSPVALVMPTSPHWYWIRSRGTRKRPAPFSGVFYSAYTPNTFGILGLPRLEADNTLQNRLTGDAEFEFGLSSSLWQSGNVSNDDQINNVASLGMTSYSATGGQFGGYLNLQMRPSVVHSPGFHAAAFFSTNPQNSLGFPYSGMPFAVEYALRFRVNSRPSNETPAGTQFRVAAIHRWSTPNTPHPASASPSGIITVNSADAPLGEWATVRRWGVVRPLDAGVTSATEHYAFAAAYFSGSGSIDFDYFNAEAHGFVNNPMERVRETNPTLYEHYSMFHVQVNSTTATIGFPADTTHPTGDWRRFSLGRRFTVSKLHTANPAFIVPSSGMTLRLAGRASVGTVTMVASLTATATIENLDGIDFMVSGNGLQ